MFVQPTQVEHPDERSHEETFVTLPPWLRNVWRATFVLQTLLTVAKFALTLIRVLNFETDLTKFSNGFFLCVCMLLVLLTGVFGSLHKAESNLFLLHKCSALFCAALCVCFSGLSGFELYRLSVVARPLSNGAQGTENVNNRVMCWYEHYTPETRNHTYGSAGCEFIDRHNTIEFGSLAALGALMVALLFSASLAHMIGQGSCGVCITVENANRSMQETQRRPITRSEANKLD